MLLELDIENYAVVDKLRVRFDRGLNLLTGETGSGKSIVVDALSLLLGARATADVIRPGHKQARVSGVFEAADSAELQELLATTALELDEGELIVDREVLESGKSRAYVNGRVVTLAVLRELAPLLGDIHGQHEQQDLFSTRAQLNMLDSFAETTELARQVAGHHASWRKCGKRLEELRGNEQEKLRLLDLYSFQHREIEDAKLAPDEEAKLEQERSLLGNLEQVQQAAASACDRIYDSPVSAAAQLKAARRAIEDLARFESSFQTIAETLDSSQASIEDAAFELRGFLDRLEPNPGRLSEIEDRLDLIHRLKRKYGGTIEEVLRYGEDAGRRLDELRSSDAAIAQVEEEQQQAAEDYQKHSGTLSKRRRGAAHDLEPRVEQELAELAMERSRFQVAFEPVKAGTPGWGAQGIDRIRFLVSANPGQPPLPLARVASGGELSRITLALKTCLTLAAGCEDQTPRTLVFDEIDSGVGGRVAEALGRRLEALAVSNQVLCVTHLPQIAGFAKAHFFVDKREQDGLTVASVARLSEKQRIEELARMLSGETITTAALRHAKQILKSSLAGAG